MSNGVARGVAQRVSAAIMNERLRIHELKDDDERYVQPTDFKVKLWPHQLTLVSRCIKYETSKIKPAEFTHITQGRTVHPDDFVQTRVGVICDSVGSGKSYAILALVMAHDTVRGGDASSDANKSVTIKSFGANKVVLSFTEVHNPIKTSILVIPHVLVSQWTNYIKEVSDNMRYVIISRQKHVDSFVKNTLEHLDQIDLVVVTSSFYNAIAKPIATANLRLQRVVFDEVDNMNLPNCLHINSQFHWFVSASYANLLHPRGNYQYDLVQQRTIWYASGLRNSGFVRNVFTDLAFNLPMEYFKILFVKNDDTYVRNSIDLPELRPNIIQCATPADIRILRGFADDDVIQCLNARDLAAALKIANPRQISTEENLIGLHISRFVRDLHNINMRIELTKSLEYDDEAARQHDLCRLEEKRIELEGRIAGIQERIRSCDTCCICYDDIQLKTVAPCCSNAFCFACLTRWLARNQTCPLCKSSLHSTRLLTVTNSEDAQTTGSDCTGATNTVDDTTLDPSHDKIKNLRALLSSRIDPATAKVLIFSSYDFTHHQIASALSSSSPSTSVLAKYKFKALKGNEAHVNNLVASYRKTSSDGDDSGDINMLLVNARHFGSGINLENTTDIIMFHKLDCELEKQVIGRAQRFGRSVPLNIWYLLHENELPPTSMTASTSAATV